MGTFMRCSLNVAARSAARCSSSEPLSSETRMRSMLISLRTSGSNLPSSSTAPVAKIPDIGTSTVPPMMVAEAFQRRLAAAPVSQNACVAIHRVWQTRQQVEAQRLRVSACDCCCKKAIADCRPVCCSRSSACAKCAAPSEIHSRFDTSAACVRGCTITVCTSVADP